MGAENQVVIELISFKTLGFYKKPRILRYTNTMQLFNDHYHGFLNWLATPTGRRFLDLELAQFIKPMQGSHGNQLLLIGNAVFHPLLKEGCFANTHAIGLNQLKKKLPYPDEKFDCIILPHVLEFVAEPELIVKEMQRLLYPEGSLLISGFYPRSFSRLLHNFTTSKPKRHDRAAAIPVRNLTKQLQAIELEEIQCTAFALGKWYRYLPLFPTAYVIKAAERREGLTPLRSRAQIIKPRFATGTSLAYEKS